MTTRNEAATAARTGADGNAGASDAELQTCAEEVLWLLGAHGVRVLFLNPGTDSAPLQEAAAALAERGVPAPRVIMSTFESVALAAAHGYWQATGEPQAVFVHVDVGTQNLGAMVHNVHRDRAGAVVLAGRTPYAEDVGSPGARSSPIHWQQDVPDQPGILRAYAKWCLELTHSRDAARVVGRAVQVAGGGIPGLAYLMLSRDVLMEPAGPQRLRRVTGFAWPVPPAAEPATVAELAGRLAAARRPVLVTSRVGRRPGGAEALAELVEMAAIPVIGRPEAVNLISSHPLGVRSQAQARTLLGEADLVLIVDCDVPWIPRDVAPPSEALVVQVDRDPVKADMPLWSFPIEVSLCAEPVTALRQLGEALAPHRVAWAESWERRRGEIVGAIAEATRAVHEAAEALDLSTDIRAVVRTLSHALDPGCLVVEEAVSNLAPVSELLDRGEAQTLHTPGGPGLGWSPGASVGIKLARPDRPVVAIVGDGAFLFGVPTAALIMAAEARAPVTIVVLNNGGYRASRLPVLALFPDGVSARQGDVIGTRFDHGPDIAALARACGAHGVRTDGADGLPAALDQALAANRNGTAAVIDVRVDQAD